MDQNQVYLIKSGQNSFVETETEITVGISGGKLGIGTTHPEADFHVTGNTQIDGDLTVKGDFTTINQTTIDLDDKNISLGVGATTDAHADGGGITVKGATDKTITFVTGADGTSDDAWEFNQNVQLENGKKFIGEQLQSSSSLNLLDSTETGITISNGKVGVNKTSPVADFDVDGSGNFSEGLFVDGNSVLTGDSSVLGKWTDGSTQGEIYYNQGNVGIGLQDPSYALDVNGSTNINGEFFVKGTTGTFNVEDFLISGDHIEINSQGNSLTSNRGGIIVNDSNNAQKTFEYVEGSNFWQSSESLQVVGGKHIQTDVVRAINTDGLSLQDDGGNGIFIEDGGNVGIGTANPSYSLDVNGSVNVGGSFTLQNEFNFGSNGAVGGIAPAAVDDIIKWNGTKWVAGANPGGGGGGGGSSEVPNALINSIASGESSQFIQFLDTYNTAPRIATDLEINGEGAIIPYSISGVSTSGYHVTFAQEVPNNNYKIHTVFGGKDVHWETGVSNSLYYNDGDVSLQRNLVVGGNLTVNGTETIVNTQTVEIEDHNIVIASNTGYNQLTNEYPSAGGAYAGILWGTGDAGGVSPVSLTYQHNNGFAFEGGNVGIGTTSPGSKLEVQDSSQGVALFKSDSSVEGAVSFIAIQSPSATSNGRTRIGADGDDLFFNTSNGATSPNTSVERMRIDTSGNVGIGTTNPGVKLDIQGGSNISSKLTLTRTDVNRTAVLSANADSPACPFVGSQSNDDFAIYTNNSAKMLIDSNGNVGIGTTNPERKLEIAADNNGDTKSNYIRITDTDTTATLGTHNGGIEFYSNDASGTPGLAAAIESIYAGSGGGGEISLSTSANSGAALVEAMRIDNAGYVGIGTTNPTSPLHVKTSATGGTLVIESDDDGSAYAPDFLLFRNSTTPAVDDNLGEIKFRGRNDDDPQSSIDYAMIRSRIKSPTNNSERGELSFWTRGGSTSQQRMVLDAFGNVGIGTAEPSQKLHVEGVFRSSVTNQPDAYSQLTWGGGLSRDNGGTGNIITTQPALIMHRIDQDGNSDRTVTIHSDNVSYFNGGNVGIGTTDPTSILHVESDDATIKVRCTAAHSPTTGPWINLQGNNSSGNTKYFGGIKAYSSGSDKGELAFNVRQSNTLTDEEAMRIDSSGNVGIGTTSPGAKLELADAVNGDVSMVIYNNDTTAASSAQTSSIDFKFARTGSSTIRRTGAKIVAGKEGEWDSTSSSQDGYLELYTTNSANSSPAMRIDSNGNVGIGTSSPSKPLEIEFTDNTIYNATNPGNCLRLENTSQTANAFCSLELFAGQTSGGAVSVGRISTIKESASNPASSLVFATKNASGTVSETMRIDSDGNVGIGATSPSAKLQVETSDNTTIFDPTDTNPPLLEHYLASLRNIYTGGNVAGTFAGIQFNVNGGGSTQNAVGAINLVVEQNNQPKAALAFTPSAATSARPEAMRINSDGNVGIGITNPSVALDVSGSIEYTGTITDVSDQRKKENVQALENSLSKICQLNGKSYEMIEDNQGEEGTELGFIAQEVQQVFPEIVKVVESQESEDGQTQEYLGVSYIQLIAPLVESIKEQQSIIEDLKSQNASLESRISALES